MKSVTPWAALQSAAVRALRWDPLLLVVFTSLGDNSFGYLRLSLYLVYYYISMPLWVRVKLIPMILILLILLILVTVKAVLRFLVPVQMIG